MSFYGQSDVKRNCVFDFMSKLFPFYFDGYVKFSYVFNASKNVLRFTLKLDLLRKIFKNQKCLYLD